MLFDLIINAPVPALYGLLAIALILLSITLHEFAHAYSATLLGDSTPKVNGRLTLNPLAHLDLIGTLFMLIGSFGWGKPVPINPFNFKDPRKGSAIVSFSGPLTNFVFALVIIGAVKVLSFFTAGLSFAYLEYALTTVILVSVGLGVFNLLPVAPLDGDKILMFFLPASARNKIEPFMQRFGLLLLIIMILPILPGGYSLISFVLSPLQHLVLKFLDLIL